MRSCTRVLSVNIVHATHPSNASLTRSFFSCCLSASSSPTVKRYPDSVNSGSSVFGGGGGESSGILRRSIDVGNRRRPCRVALESFDTIEDDLLSDRVEWLRVIPAEASNDCDLFADARLWSAPPRLLENSEAKLEPWSHDFRRCCLGGEGGACAGSCSLLYMPKLKWEGVRRVRRGGRQQKN